MLALLLQTQLFKAIELRPAILRHEYLPGSRYFKIGCLCIEFYEKMLPKLM